jgi:hypothetical protein
LDAGDSKRRLIEVVLTEGAKHDEYPKLYWFERLEGRKWRQLSFVND